MSYSPYAPPRHDPHHPYAGYGYQFVYQPLGWKTTGIVVGVAATVVLQFVVTAMVWAVGGSLGEGNLGAAGALVLASLILQGVTMFTGITFLVWMHNAAKNIRTFGHQGLEFTPGWAVGWWFIPIASLWKPFQALREIWRGSDPDNVGTGSGSWMTSGVPSVFGLWWTTYLLAGFTGMFAALPGILAGGGAASSATPAISMVSHLLNAFAGVAIILIVRQLAQRQAASYEKIQAMQQSASGHSGGYGGGYGPPAAGGPPGYPPYGATGS